MDGRDTDPGEACVRIRRLSHCSAYALFLTAGGATLGLTNAANARGVVMALNRVDASSQAAPVGLESLASTSNYLAADDSHAAVLTEDAADVYFAAREQGGD